MSGVKYDENKLRYDLIPAYPLAKVAEVYTVGAAKYEDRNWEKGLSWGRVFAAMQRHAWAWWSGERDDADNGQHHLASVVWCALALLEYEQTHPELDDRPRRVALPKVAGEAKACTQTEPALRPAVLVCGIDDEVAGPHNHSVR